MSIRSGVRDCVDTSVGELHGAHIDVHLAAGLVRQYSLVSSMTCRDSYEIAVLREPRSRGGSRYVHDRLEEGQAVRIGAPRIHFALEDSAQRTVLLAGGIGVTPILCMAEYLSSRGRGVSASLFCPKRVAGSLYGSVDGRQPRRACFSSFR